MDRALRFGMIRRVTEETWDSLELAVMMNEQQRFLGNILRHTDGKRHDYNNLAFEVFKKIEALQPAWLSGAYI